MRSKRSNIYSGEIFWGNGGSRGDFRREVIK